MSVYRAVNVYVEVVPEGDGDKPARVLAGDGRMVLERGDISPIMYLTPHLQNIEFPGQADISASGGQNGQGIMSY